MFVSRARCSAEFLRSAASQNRDPGYGPSKLGPGSAADRFAKSYALRCVRGTRES